MATKKASKKAGPAKATQAANEHALIGFDASVVADCMRSMSRSKAEADAAGETKAEAAHRLIVHAHQVATESREAGVETDIDKAWSANLKALYPALANDGVSFIKVEEKPDGERKFTLSGYGQNVNSVARGFCQYSDIEPDADGRIAEDRRIVEARRALDLSAEEMALREAKERLDAALKAYRKAAVDGNDADLINQAAEALETATADMEADNAEAEAIEAEAEAANAA